MPALSKTRALYTEKSRKKGLRPLRVSFDEGLLNPSKVVIVLDCLYNEMMLLVVVVSTDYENHFKHIVMFLSQISLSELVLKSKFMSIPEKAAISCFHVSPLDYRSPLHVGP